MKRLIGFGGLALAALTFVAIAAGATSSTDTYGPYAVTTTDGGCAGNTWAVDTESRRFQVKKGPDASGHPTWRVRRTDKGTFRSNQGTSPGNCASNTGPHGATVSDGVKGKLNGYLQGTVTGGTYNPNATCASPCTTTAFISAFFGSSAHFTCLDGYAGCAFSFDYRADPGQRIRYTHWVDASVPGGEKFTGDIAQ